MKSNRFTLTIAFMIAASISATETSFDDLCGEKYVGTDRVFLRAGAINKNAASSAKNPFASLQDVERHSKKNDIICVLHSDKLLDGGIVLKDGQKLIGISHAGSQITNKSPVTCKETPHEAQPESCGAHAIVLANDNEVSGIHIFRPNGSGIVGLNRNGANLHDILITSPNESKSYWGPRGLEGINANTGIGLFNTNRTASSYRLSKIRITGYKILGIIVFRENEGTLSFDADNLDFKLSGFDPDILITSETEKGWGASLGADLALHSVGPKALISAKIDHSSFDSGNLTDTHFGQGISENGESHLIINNSYFGKTNSAGGSNGFIVASFDSKGGKATTLIENSLFDGSGEQIELWTMKVPPPARAKYLDRGVPGLPQIFVEVDSCILQNDQRLGGIEVLTMLENTDNMAGAADFKLKVSNTTIKTANRRAFYIGNKAFGPPINGFLGSYEIDLGGGALGSPGNNRFFHNAVDFQIDQPITKFSAQKNWWGTKDGPTFGKDSLTTVDASLPLAHDPGEPILHAGIEREKFNAPIWSIDSSCAVVKARGAASH